MIRTKLCSKITTENIDGYRAAILYITSVNVSHHSGNPKLEMVKPPPNQTTLKRDRKTHSTKKKKRITKTEIGGKINFQILFWKLENARN